MAARVPAPFMMGKKSIYLPGGVFKLVRGNGTLPPNQALFHVPLETNKFDVRDYLYNLYGLVTTNVKIMVQLQPLVRGTKGEQRRRTNPRIRLPWHRPRSIKKAIVTMTEPFKYPDPQKDLKPWRVEERKESLRAQLDEPNVPEKRRLMRFQVNGSI